MKKIKKLEKLLAYEGKVALDGGTWFGEGGSGFMRLNLHVQELY